MKSETVVLRVRDTDVPYPRREVLRNVPRLPIRPQQRAEKLVAVPQGSVVPAVLRS